MKKILILMTALFLAACSTPKANLVHSEQPILNITAELDRLIDAKATLSEASLYNKSNAPVVVRYLITWYDRQGVTQLQPQFQLEQFAEVWQLARLQPQQKYQIELIRPTANSVNYRLYLTQK